ncbi:hypothetical protein [Marinicellulosiphila megalodicopiae]|uniref:hypothetical protein n=1 Tax=Marinicellulosiphila megalodicopiae TaxID=2724896 RepID=UPI003BAFA531
MYKFKIRPGYKSSNLLIDFTIDNADDLFFGTLYDALSPLNISELDLTDLWVNDEIIFQCNSDLGRFEITRDFYDLVFILAENNQRVIKKISELLSNHKSFSNQSFNSSEYS